MSTILGPLPCQACRQPVAVVRRTVEVPCDLSGYHPPTCPPDCDCRHTHAIPDVAWTVVELDGTTHICKAAA